jgi:hypothetical protein
MKIVTLPEGLYNNLVEAIKKIENTPQRLSEELRKAAEYIASASGDPNNANALWFFQKADEVVSDVNVKDKLLHKLTTKTGLILLQKNERKLIKPILNDIQIDFSHINKYSSLTNVTNSNKFNGFPLLQRKIREKINKIQEELASLCTLDQDVFLQKGE